jgi:hypothetical protein
MRSTDYENIAQVLGITISEAQELEMEQRRWCKFLASKEDSGAFKATLAHR